MGLVDFFFKNKKKLKYGDIYVVVLLEKRMRVKSAKPQMAREGGGRKESGDRHTEALGGGGGGGGGGH